MKTLKINKPYSKSFNTLLGGYIVSYSPRTCRVAIGTTAVQVTQDEMNQILNAYSGYGERFDIVVSFFNKYIRD